MRPSYDLESYREGIPVLADSVALANCSHTPRTDEARQAVASYLDSWGRKIMDWDAWMEQVDQAKAEFAALIHASVDEVAMMPSVTAAAAVVASTFDHARPRRRVLVSAAEFPSVGHVWLARRRYGAEIDWVPMRGGAVPLAGYAERLDERTELVCACHAFYRNGVKQDVRSIARAAHAEGALLFVDAYQTAGLHPIDVRAMEVDFLTSGVHKFLMGIPGIAFLYVRRDLIERLEPSLTGWFGRRDIFAFDPQRLDWAPTANRFEMATPPVVAAYVARAGIRLIREIGCAAIREWTDALSRRLIDGARARGLEIYGPTRVEHKTATTAIVCPGDAAEIEKRLLERRIHAAARGDVIRLAPHFFTRSEEIDVALDALADLVGAR